VSVCVCQGLLENFLDLLESVRGMLDNNCFYYHYWRNNVVIAFGSFLTQLESVSVFHG